MPPSRWPDDAVDNGTAPDPARLMLRHIFSGRRIVLPASIMAQAITFVRNTLVARMLGPEQFGLAVTFLLAQQFLEMASESGIRNYLLQSRIGNRPSLQATVQIVSSLRGVAVSVILMAVAYPLFMLWHLGGSVVPFALLGLTSISAGLAHFDTIRQQRLGNFVPNSVSSVIGEIAGLVGCIVALAFTRSYLVVLCGILARALATSVSSHLFATRRYRLRYSRALAAVMFTFSWPLLINGPLMFVSSQADRVIVNAALGLRELGIYSAAILLLTLPLGLLTRVLGSVSMPRLAASHHQGLLSEEEPVFTGATLTTYLLAATGFTAVGPTVLVLLYGPTYAQEVLPLCLIGLTQSMRFLRTWPSGLALAVGQTGNLLLSTVIRLVAIPLGLIGILLGDGIAGMAIGLLLGEALSLLISIAFLNRARGLPTFYGGSKLGIAYGVAIVLPFVIWAVDPGPVVAAAIAAAVLAASIIAMYVSEPKLVPRNLRAFGW